MTSVHLIGTHGHVCGHKGVGHVRPGYLSYRDGLDS